MKKNYYDMLDDIDDEGVYSKKKLDRLESEQERIRRRNIARAISYEDFDGYDDYDDETYSPRKKRGAKKSNSSGKSKNTYKHGASGSKSGKNRSGSSRSKSSKISSKKNRKKSGGSGIFKKIIRIILVIVLLVLIYMFWKYQYLEKTETDNIQTSYNTGLRYTNVALFGLDSREGEIESGVRSDTIIIMSIDNLTQQVRMVSVLRDSFLQFDDSNFNKVNAAFSYGGAQQACEVLNQNLDLDIKNFAVINFTALIKGVDAVGGIDLDMTSEEVYWLNGYQLETASTCGMESEVFDLPVQDGVQHLNGVQATAYCRIRYVGTDTARTNRQRIVLQALFDQVKTHPWLANSMIDEMFPYISTNMSYPRYASIGIRAPFYKIEDGGSFPYETYDTDRISGFKGSYVIPYDLSANVSKLHEFLFNDTNYVTTNTVDNITSNIVNYMGY